MTPDELAEEEAELLVVRAPERLAHELEGVARDMRLTPDLIFRAVERVHRRIKGSG